MSDYDDEYLEVDAVLDGVTVLRNSKSCVLGGRGWEGGLLRSRDFSEPLLKCALAKGVRKEYKGGVPR